jgi:nitroreductase
MEFAQLMRERFSARAFRPEPVPRAVLENALALCQRSPSWCNTQPWHLIVASGAACENFRTALYQYALSGAPADSDFPFPAGYHGEFRQRRIECAAQLYSAVGVARDDRAGAQRQSLENFRFFGAPHVAILTMEEFLGFYGGVDCGVYIGNFWLALNDAGVGCIAQAALAMYSGFVRDYFSIPPNRKIVCGFSFGYIDSAHPVNVYRTARAAGASAVDWLD